jgi:hypothetical protein
MRMVRTLFIILFVSIFVLGCAPMHSASSSYSGSTSSSSSSSSAYELSFDGERELFVLQQKVTTILFLNMQR